MQILHISAECYPIAKVGGLADVVGALPKYQEAEKVISSVIMPYYDNDFTKGNKFVRCGLGEIEIGGVIYAYEVLEVDKNQLGFLVFLVKIKNLTDRENVYGYADDVERFIGFQKVVADFILDLEHKPDVIHCHDHHTGFVPFFISYCKKYTSLQNIPTALTIHNAQYQGNFGYERHNYLPEYDTKHSGIIDWYGSINPLATAIKCAWKVTTVSPNYLIELQQKANGLEGLLHHEHNKSIGILNGIDNQIWNPKTDPMLVANFDRTTIKVNKKRNKEWICEEFGLDVELPLISFIGRFVYEKASDLLPSVLDTVLGEQNLKVNILVLGSGDSETQDQLNVLKEKYKGRYNNYIGYNEKLSRIIYGGSDFLLMPSRVEPCGLNQLYAMRYGTIPIVSNVGGLKDTVIDVDSNEKGYGIVLTEVTVNQISLSIKRAIDIYEDTSFFEQKRKQIMKIESGWDTSAKTYIKMYDSLIQKK